MMTGANTPDERVETLERQLAALDDESLFERERVDRARMEAAQKALAEKQEAERFFNLPGAVADFDHWSRCTFWTLDEAVALALGRDPSKVTPTKVSPHAGQSAFAQEFLKFREVARRAAVSGQITDPTSGGAFLAWADRLDLPVDTKLRASVTSRGIEIADWKSRYDALLPKYERATEVAEQNRKAFETSTLQFADLLAAVNKRDAAHRAEVQVLHQSLANARQAPKQKAAGAVARERASMLKLVAGLVAACYGSGPARKRRELTAEVASDLAKAGVPLDVDTVRKYLKEAADVLPPAEDD